MADLKISQLTAITTLTPATDILPVVDVTGTTKKITVNQILGSGGTATLASATISGAASAAGLSVTGSTIPTNGVYLPSANNLGFAYNSTLGMTLNATGLGVGVASPAFKLQVVGTSGSLVDLCGSAVAGLQTLVRIRTATANTSGLLIQGNVSNDEMYINNFYNAALSFGTNNTERMRIDSSGNVGIGVTPSAIANVTRLEIKGAISSNVTIRSASSNTAARDWMVACNANAFGDLVFRQGNSQGADPNSGTDRLVLDASGNLLVGKTASSTTVAGSQIQPDGTFSAVKGDANPGFFYNRSTAASGTIALFRSNSVTVGSITQDGTNTSYVTTSDYRLKEDVQPLVGGLARVSALKPSIYKWKSNGSTGEGFLAHELADVVPSAVIGSKDEVNEDGSIKAQGVDLSKVVPILVAAIQELAARVQTLEAK